jgi:tetratricopeptide (TPR) repeat protein
MSSSFVVQRASVPAVVFIGLLGSACATKPTGDAELAVPGSSDRVVREPPDDGETEADPSRWLADAEAALEHEQPAKAATLFARYLARGAAQLGPEAARAYHGLARAHEQLGDFEAAIRAYDGFLAHFPEDPEAHRMLARRGACEAEIEQWERSASSYAQVLELGADALIPSQRVEALARQGYALYQLGRFPEADAVLAEADAIFETATSTGQERFSDTYFIGLARFYRAAILHLEFRAVPIRLPEAQMSKDFERKLELLEQAQDAYNQVIRARHLYWVSAAGYQLGSLFEEFYDAVMYAPVPDWLDEQQRRTYYAELEEQLRPVIDKAVWVFEKNLETARKFGYESEFIERSEAQLAELQAIMLGRGESGAPVPRLAPQEARQEIDPETAIAFEELPAVERKLFVPMPTTL